MSTRQPTTETESLGNDDPSIIVVDSYKKENNLLASKPLVFDDDDDDESQLESDNEAKEIDSMVNRFKTSALPVIDADDTTSAGSFNKSGLAINSEPSDKDKNDPGLYTIAPSYQDILENPGDGALVVERGNGRYFGVEDDSSRMTCRQCGGEGHKAADCTVLVCNSCGQRNDHYSRDCTKFKKCTKCGKMGHLRKDCEEKQVRIHCRLCDSFSHNEDTCLTIWRSYIVSKNSKTHYPDAIYCYNCGQSGHYGDDCFEPRRVQLRFVEDSAFTGRILPREYQNRYFDQVQADKRKHESYKRNKSERYGARRDQGPGRREQGSGRRESDRDYRSNRGASRSYKDDRNYNDRNYNDRNRNGTGQRKRGNQNYGRGRSNRSYGNYQNSSNNQNDGNSDYPMEY